MTQRNRHVLRAIVSLLVVAALTAPARRLSAQARVAGAVAVAKPFAIEFYYKVKWGTLDEFLALYKKNHLPILRRQQQDGRIIAMHAAFPVNHAGEANRWDFRFTIVYRDVIAAHEETSEALIRDLYPDQASFTKEEQRRFELLVEHMDIPITLDDLTTWR